MKINGFWVSLWVTNMNEWFVQIIRTSVRFVLVGASLFLALLFLTGVFGPLRVSLNLNNKNLDEKNLFSVSGEGSVFVKPDLATVTLGIQIQDRSVAIGQKKVNQVINAVTISLKQLKISEKDIQTTSYSIYPNYSYDSGRQTLNGYNLSANLNVKIRDFEVLDKVIDSSAQAGANQIGALNFSVEDEEKVKDEARRKAVDQAKQKAQKLAQISGLKLGRVVNVRETGGFEPRPMYALAKEAGAPVLDGSTQIQPGQAEIKVNVSLDYETL